MAGKRRAQDQQYAADQEMQQDEQMSAPQPAPAEAPPAAGGMSQDTLSQLKELGQLHEQGVLTDDEFAQQKAKLLGQ
jgi:Short C-terminal domain